MSEIKGLGRGIRALIPESTLASLERPVSPQAQVPRRRGEVVWVRIESIRTGRFQPRRSLDESSIHKLADSIRESGLIYPLLVRKNDKSGDEHRFLYELIAGERRLRALKFLGETEAPVLVKEITDRKAMEMALVENLQREELNPIEEALGYQRLIQEFELTQEEVAGSIGKDRTTLSNTLRLLKLSESVREEVASGRLTLGHARALLGLESEKAQKELAQRIITEGLSVRRTEQRVKSLVSDGARPRSRGLRDPHLGEAEQKLQRALGTKVEILHGRSRGWIRIVYDSLKDLDRLLERLT